MFRYARHTNDLRPIVKFYTEAVGLELLGSFEDHDNYNGVFLGRRNSDWHLEFTASDKKAHSTFDEDDALIFYVNSEIELEKIRSIISANAIKLQVPKLWILALGNS